MKKVLITAALLAGMCGLAVAQGAGGEPPKASDANPPAATRATPGEARTAPMTAAPVAMKKKKKGGTAATNSKNRAQGSETGSAKDSAGPAGMRGAPGTGGTK